MCSRTRSNCDRSSSRRFTPATASPTEAHSFPDPGKASTSARGKSCCPPNVQARLNVSACGDPVLGHFPTGGDGELEDLTVFGLCTFWLSALEEVGREQGGVDASTDDCSSSRPSRPDFLFKMQ